MAELVTRSQSREKLIFGVLLISLGALFLLDHFGVLDVGRYWQWWPAWPIAIGLVKVFGGGSAEHVGGGVTMTLIGVWCLICVHDWYGISWHNGWPLVFVAIGAGMVTRALLSRPRASADGTGAPHA